MKPLLPIVTLAAALAFTGCGANANAKPATGSASTEVTLPQGTTLPLSLTSSVASDTNAVEDAVTAELTHTVTLDGRDVLPAGATLSGVVTVVDGSRPPQGTGDDRIPLQISSDRKDAIQGRNRRLVTSGCLLSRNLKCASVQAPTSRPT